MNLRSQRKLASKILDVGIDRVWIDPDRVEDVSKAITREDIKALVKEGAISAQVKKGVSRGRIRKKHSQKKKGQRKGQGSRKGKKTARSPKKKNWIRKIRAIRDELKKLKAEGKIEEKEYRRLYRQVKGNVFQSRRHLREHIVKT
jgi:large subunit ribosomal protein L19e